MSKLSGPCCRVAAILWSITVLQPYPAAAMDAQKHAAIEQLIKDMGLQANLDRLIDVLLPPTIANLKKINPSIPQAVWDEFTRIGADEFKRALPELTEPLVVVYDSNFTADEIEELDAFYRSPLGHKLVAVLPQLTQQTVALGQVWGERVGKRVEERIRAAAKEKGYNL
jgi:uncharacterized protein